MPGLEKLIRGDILLLAFFLTRKEKYKLGLIDKEEYIRGINEYEKYISDTMTTNWGSDPYDVRQYIKK